MIKRGIFMKEMQQNGKRNVGLQVSTIFPMIIDKFCSFEQQVQVIGDKRHAMFFTESFILMLRSINTS